MKRNLLIGFIMAFSFMFMSVATAETDMETPKESETIEYLQQGLAVFLCFYNIAEPNLDKIKSEIKSVASNFKGALADVYVSGDDKKEDGLREKFKISTRDTAVFVISPPGTTVARLEGAAITKANLLKVLYTPRGGCCGGASKKTCK